MMVCQKDQHELKYVKPLKIETSNNRTRTTSEHEDARIQNAV